jgi:fido (protein-threonine AMPylation protein)
MPMCGHGPVSFAKPKEYWHRQMAIATELRYLLDDIRYWHENNTYPPDEIAVRFKHRLVSIHCFPNGNGRHSRLMADIIIEKIYKHPYLPGVLPSFPA